MSVNKYQSHVLVLPEDDANRQLANGFLLDPSLLIRQIQVLGVAGGWEGVLDRFKREHVPEMHKYPHRFMVLLVDFDADKGRLDQAKSVIPEQLIDRVFVLGAWTEPEPLKSANLGSYETIGMAMAKDCREETDTTWGHDLISAQYERDCPFAQARSADPVRAPLKHDSGRVRRSSAPTAARSRLPGRLRVPYVVSEQ
jgi:hypothetical protein